MNPLGYHVNYWTPDAKRTVRTAPGAVLKVLNTAVDRAEIGAYRQARSDGVVVFRWVEDGGSLADVPGRVRATLDAMKDIADLVQIVETPWNECHQGASELPAYADATVQAIRLIEAEGYEVAFGNFSVGQPEHLDDLRWFIERVLSALPPGRKRWLSLHEYSAPNLRDAVGQRCLRYRAVLDLLVRYRAGLLISECGIDGGVLQLGKRAGWRSYASAESYASQFRWYAREIADDRARYGIDIRAAIYCCGQFGDWADYDVAAVPEIASLLKETIMPETPTTFSIGPGIAAKMKEQGDTPRSSEHYIGDFLSVAFGDKGVYIYSKEANRTYFLAAR